MRQAREAADLSREALAGELGISVSTLARAELADQVPNFVTAARIARRLGLSLDDLATAHLGEVSA